MVLHDKVYSVSSFVDEHPYVTPSFNATAKSSSVVSETS